VKVTRRYRLPVQTLITKSQTFKPNQLHIPVHFTIGRLHTLWWSSQCFASSSSSSSAPVWAIADRRDAHVIILFGSGGYGRGVGRLLPIPMTTTHSAPRGTEGGTPTHAPTCPPKRGRRPRRWAREVCWETAPTTPAPGQWRLSENMLSSKGAT
jgi:hypothetical protein